jgi:molybdopterin molybdotransferase
MVTVNEAAEIIFSNLFRPIPEKISIHNAVGRILGEKILADRDFPPFDRVAMDGIAIAYESWKSGRKDFFIEQTQAAGEPQKKLTDKRNCLEVMTGSVLPQASDTVIRYEDLELEAKQATITLDTVQPRQNIHQQGQDARQGSVLLEEGIMLSPAEIALLASVGKDEVQVFGFPKTAIISSGDELLNISQIPQP